MKNVMTAAYDLKDEIEKDARAVKLKQTEEEMEKDEKVMELSYRFSLAQNEYNDALRYFNEGSLEIKEVQKKLYLAKKALDEHHLVQKYLQAFAEVRQLYEKIDHELYEIFMKHQCEKK